MDRLYKLSPSDFGYLWKDCKHCYWQKVKYGIATPGIFPSMFGRINTLLQNSIMGMNLQEINPELPSGIVNIQEGYLKSMPIGDCFISGRFDILSKLDDGTYSIIDFKITTPDDEKIQKYKSQLHAYKYALENPAQGYPIKVSKLGVVSVNPETMKHHDGKIHFTASPTFHPIEEDMDEFLSLIKDVSKVLNGPMPEPSQECSLCRYRGFFIAKPQKEESLTNLFKNSKQEDIPF
jgi:hypothetical protein